MATQSGKKLMSALPAGEFSGRRSEFDRLLHHARSTGGLRLLSPPWAGASELLRQIYDRLFFESGDIIPFYFALRSSEESAEKAATRFLQEFLLQVIAFRQRDSGVYASSPEICELSKLAPVEDATWFERLIEKCDVDSPVKDERSFVRNCLSAPLRAATAGVQAFVLLDDLHNAVQFSDGGKFVAELTDIYWRAAVPFVFSARRRFSIPEVRLPTLELDDLETARAAELVATSADSMNVAINDQTRDLIAAQAGGRAGFIRALFATARSMRRSLDSFQHVEQVYTEEILKGALGSFYREVIDLATPAPANRRELIRLLFDGLNSQRTRIRLDTWQKKIGSDPAEFHRVLETLDLAEMISLDGSLVRVAGENHVLADTIRSRYRIECAAEPRAVVAGEILAGSLKRAPQMMARLYRRQASLGLARMLSAFDCQEIPRAMLDYGVFRSEYKGLSQEEIETRMEVATKRMTLPQIVHTAPSEEYYPSLANIVEAERAIVAIGFNDHNYADEGQVVWLAAEIESKLEADLETAQSWLQNLEKVAEANKFTNYQIWLIAPEGFSDGALDALAERNAIGTSRRQAVMLSDLLGAAQPAVVESEGVEYEMVIPVGEDTELIAAHALEEIARRHKFSPKAINQLKTALVEACINAAEHGLAPDRKIHQRFLVSDDKITISISNRGIRLADRLAAQPAEGEEAKTQPIEAADTRRGWGLNLIRGLMDDVRVEPVDDGTRITMTKFLREEARV
jgi:serine/threonine-protein kinase RsbW